MQRMADQVAGYFVVAVVAVAVLTFLAWGLFGYLFREARVWERLFLLGAAITLIKPGLVTDLIGAGLVLIVLLSQFIIRRGEIERELPRPVAHD